VLEGCEAVQELLQDVARQLNAVAQQVQRGLRVVSQVRCRRVLEVRGCGTHWRCGQREGGVGRDRGEGVTVADDRGPVVCQTGHGVQVVWRASR
jgi:hypothetical protein